MTSKVLEQMLSADFDASILVLWLPRARVVQEAFLPLCRLEGVWHSNLTLWHVGLSMYTAFVAILHTEDCGASRIRDKRGSKGRSLATSGLHIWLQSVEAITNSSLRLRTAHVSTFSRWGGVEESWGDAKNCECARQGLDGARSVQEDIFSWLHRIGRLYRDPMLPIWLQRADCFPSLSSED